MARFISASYSTQLHNESRSNRPQFLKLLPSQISDIRSNVVSHVISNIKFKGSVVQSLRFDGVTMFCTLRQRDARDNRRKLTIKILDFAPDYRDAGGSLTDNCRIS